MAELAGAVLMFGGTTCALMAVIRELRGHGPYERRVDLPPTWWLIAAVLWSAGIGLLSLA